MGHTEVLAAGAVVTRRGRRGPEVLLIHRPRYDDWSFPKGKVDAGEHVLGTAVREVEEETGLRVRLGPALRRQHYEVAGRPKVVHYWVARVAQLAGVAGDDDVSGWVPTAEVDRVAWVPWEDALRRLTYRYDRQTLEQAETQWRRTRTLVVLRHGHAEPRKTWSGDDRLRPLADEGCEQADQLVPVLGAWGVTRLVTSSSTRCTQTLDPYAAATGRHPASRAGLSEEDASVPGVTALVEELLGGREPTVVCTHRPVLPAVLDALGLGEEKLEPAEMVVVHHRRGAVVATERHHPRPS